MAPSEADKAPAARSPPPFASSSRVKLAPAMATNSNAAAQQPTTGYLNVNDQTSSDLNAQSNTAASTTPSPWYSSIRQHLSTNPPSYNWSSSNEQSLLEPYTYLVSRPGKEIRGRLIDAFNFWLQVPPHRLKRVRKVVDMLHNASLLMDDVEDNSDLRRGLPVAHKVYGVPQVLNSANYIYFLVFREVEAMGSESPPASQRGSMHESSSQPNGSSDHTGHGGLPSQDHQRRSSSFQKATKSERLLVEEMVNLHRGQGLDLLWRDTLQCPTEEEYVEMVRNKTGGLLRIAGGLMTIWSPLYSDDATTVEHNRRQRQRQRRGGGGGMREEDDPQSPPDLLPLLDLIGLLFQIRDDYMNLSADSYAQNKGFAEDLTEGKFSFPMIHGIRWSGQGDAGATRASTSTSGAGVDVTSALPRMSSPIPRYSSPLPHISTSASSTTAPSLPNRQLLSILSAKPTDVHLKRYAVDYLRDVTGSFAYCRKVMRQLDKCIWDELQAVEARFQAAVGGHVSDIDADADVDADVEVDVDAHLAQTRASEEATHQGQHQDGRDGIPCNSSSSSSSAQEHKTTTRSNNNTGRNEELRKILEALRSGWWDDDDDGDEVQL